MAPRVVKPKKPVKQPAPGAGFVMYLGPTIVGVIQNASVYSGTLQEVTEKLAGVIEKYPRVRALLVSGDTLPEDRVNVQKPGTRLYDHYMRLRAEVK